MVAYERPIQVVSASGHPRGRARSPQTTTIPFYCALSRAFCYPPSLRNQKSRRAHRKQRFILRLPPRTNGPHRRSPLCGRGNGQPAHLYRDALNVRLGRAGRPRLPGDPTWADTADAAGFRRASSQVEKTAPASHPVPPITRPGAGVPRPREWRTRPPQGTRLRDTCVPRIEYRHSARLFAPPQPALGGGYDCRSPTHVHLPLRRA